MALNHLSQLRRLLLTFCGVGFILPIFVNAQDPSEIAAGISDLVNASLEDYRELEGEIADAKTPLVMRMTELEEQNLQLRSEVESYRFLSERIAGEINELGKEGNALQSQADYIRSAFENFLVKFESRVNLAEGQRYFDTLERLRNRTDAAEGNLGQRFAGFAEALNLSLERAEAALGGERFDGQAIDSEGRIYSGKVVVYGPSSYFLAEDGGKSGVLRYNPGAIEPGVTFVDGELGSSLAQTIQSGSGVLPLDATLGDALALRDSQGDVFAHVRQGGVVGYFILLLGAMAFVVCLLKVRDLRGFRAPSAEEIGELSRLARGDNKQAALKKAESIPGVASEVLSTGVRNIDKNALLLEETMLSVILRSKPKMERYLPFLAITAAASPLLGLLGTVVGLIKTFALITIYGAGAPTALSSGISEALITTELGLIVAIPTLILHGLLSRVIRTRIGVLEQTAFDFVETTNLDN